MAIRLNESKLNMLVQSLSEPQYKEFRARLHLSPTEHATKVVLDHVVRLFRHTTVGSKEEVMEKTGCTDSTYRSYKTRLIDTVLWVLSSAHRSGMHQWLRDLEKAWVLTELGEHRAAYDLADTILKDSLAQERGAVARLALEVMSSTAQEAYPDKATTLLKQVGEQMFHLAGKLFSMTDLYELYLTVGCKASRTLLLRTHYEFAQWRAWEQRADMHENTKDFPLSHWAYLALSKCHIHELKGEVDVAFDWYDRLWKKLMGDQHIIQLGDKRFLASFQSYVLLAIRSGRAMEAKEANRLFGQVIQEHHKLEVQQQAIHAFFNLQVKWLQEGTEAIGPELNRFIDLMRQARQNEAYHHRSWSPHIRYEIYRGLFNRCFERNDLARCKLMLKWGNDRSPLTETSADLSSLVPLLLCVVQIQECVEDGKLQLSLLNSMDESFAKSAYDKFRRKQDAFRIETELATFLFKVSRADASTFAPLKATTLQTLTELKESAFYYTNLMYYFDFEQWIGKLRVD